LAVAKPEFSILLASQVSLEVTHGGKVAPLQPVVDRSRAREDLFRGCVQLLCILLVRGATMKGDLNGIHKVYLSN